MSEKSKAVVRGLFERIIAGGELDAVDEVFAADYRDHDPANDEDTRGPDGVKEEVGGYRAAFPDLRVDIHEQLADGDRVVTRFTFRGTHNGELLGVPATGRSMSCDGIAIHRVADGRIAEGWWNWDTLGLLRQVGALPQEQPA